MTLPRCSRSASVLVIAALALLGAAPAAKPKPGAAPKLKSVTIAIRNRIFHEFADQQQVLPGKPFTIGDTDYSAKMVQYVPDFAMDISNGKVISRSNEPKNPAFKIIVSQKNKPQDTTWAMMSLPPHFTRRSFLAFKVMRIDFVGREPIVVDSVQAYKELEALKDQARKNAKPEEEPNPHGGMGMTLNPHGAGGPLPHGTATGMNPHGGAAGANPHGGGIPPAAGTSIPMTPSHGSGGTTDKTKDSK
ncbi:MAG TPA: hypothetical protein VE326_14935 [Candidatus Binatia bacterium]|nr:hypothetical protein [Candidatus Binatia bacterium]